MFCGWCGKEIKDAARFCPYCGRAVKEPERVSPAPKKRRKRLRRILTSILLLLLVAVAGVVGFLVYQELKGGVSEEIDRKIAETIEPYLNEDGVFDYDEEQLEKAGQEVYAYAQELAQEGDISDATYCGEAYSVAFFLNDGTVEVYLPEIADMYAGDGEEDEFSVMLVNNHINEENWESTAATEMYYTSPLDIVSENFEGSDTEEYSESVTVDSLKTILSSLGDNMRAIFWRGHGGAYTDLNGEKVFFFVLGEEVSGEENKYAEERAKDENGVAQVVTTSSDHYAVTYQYMEQYLGQNSGGLFFTTSCLAMADGGKMAEVFLDKGFDSYVGSTDVVNVVYGNRLMKEVVQNLCKKDDSGQYMTIADALQEAADSLSDVSIWTPLGDFVDIYGQLFGTFVNYQQFDFRLVDHSKVYCTLTSEDGTVDLSQLSVKLVRTDANGTHTASDRRIEGAELEESGGRFLLYDLSTDASCQLDISYGSTVLKKYSIDEIDPGAESISIDLSLAYLDVIVEDQQGQFLTNASVSVYGKVGDSGTEGLVQAAELTLNESGEQVYRIPVTPGTYYVTVTVDGAAVTSDSEVKVDQNTTVTYAQNNLEDQVELLSGLCGSLAVQDPFGYATYLSCWVSDYDQNGRLELNFSLTEGSGIFTTWRCYEVNESLDGVTEIVWDYDTYMPDGFTDLLPGDEDSGQQSEPGYYDAATGCWYYIMYDVVRAGAAQNGTSYYSMRKNGTALELVELGWLRNDNSADGTTTTYTVGENTYGSETDFYNAMLAKMANMQEFSYTVTYFDILESTDYYSDLWNSASAFCGVG